MVDLNESELPRRLSDLWDIEPAERDKAIKLISKILHKLITNPTVAKFGDLNFHKIREKLQHCRPAFYLLYEAGFKQSMDGTRLQWTYSEDNYNLLTKTNNALQQKLKEPDMPKKKKKEEKPATEEWEGTAYRRRIQQKMKREESEQQRQRNLIKEKIAMQRKEQKLEQQRLLQKIKEKKEKQKEEATEFIKEQMMTGMNEMMQEMMKSLMPQNEQQQEQKTAEQQTANGDGNGTEKTAEEAPESTKSEELTKKEHDGMAVQEDQMEEDDQNVAEVAVDGMEYDEEVVSNLVALEIGTREQCIQASRLADDYKDAECVAEALQNLLNENEKQ